MAHLLFRADPRDAVVGHGHVELLPDPRRVVSQVSGMVGAVDTTGTASASERDDPLPLVNAAAGQAGGAWLVALGLVAAIEELRVAHDVEPIPAPGFEVLRELAVRADTEVVTAAETVRLLAGQDLEADDWLVDDAVERALDATDEVERATRALAQLALGVAQPLPAGDDVDRLERAAVSVLALGPIAVPAHAEQSIELHGRFRDELVIELCGLIARLLVDHTGTVEVTGDGAGGVLLTAIPDESLEITTPGGEHVEALRALGWTGRGDSLSVRYESPMVIIEVVDLVVRTLLDVHDHSPEALVVRTP